MYVHYDETNGLFSLELPEDLKKHQAQAVAALQEEFAFETLGVEVLQEMNDFLSRWFSAQGLAVKGGQK
ncbi:hypothetical protein SAMN05920897_1214 [Alkalispirochaeta americana]|uniref:Uncharacterized protein n=1 Tax=Alkalispirochaeta americana TaxID=159291 RepID=A0A1N6X7B0_9SPIO|nr:hypothetical protein [Alkalispirochaeta americana]SIQ98244.1 hypothetical protein SAMN05920897_1214 [Alkalispirochaeta americana]